MKKLSKRGTKLLDITNDFVIDAAHFWRKVDKSGDCWEYKGPFNTTGYGIYHAMTPPDRYEETGRMRTMIPAHRVAYHLGYGAVSPWKLVCHQCDNPRCCNPAHLFQGSQQHNMTDRVLKVAQGTLPPAKRRT